jgi:hypothetical protein
MSSLVTATLLAALSEVPAGGCIRTANVVIYGRAEHLISITLLIKGDIARYPSKLTAQVGIIRIQLRQSVQNVQTKTKTRQAQLTVSPNRPRILLCNLPKPPSNILI